MSFNLSVAGLIAIVACGLAIPGNAEPVKARGYGSAGDFDPTSIVDALGALPASGNGGKPLSLSEDDNIGREPTSKTIRLAGEANTIKDGYSFIPDPLELFVDSVARSFRSGDNIAYQFYKRFQREVHSPPPDPTYSAETFIARNRRTIPYMLESQFHLASSNGEAYLILTNMQQELEDREILARRAGRPAEYRRPIF